MPASEFDIIQRYFREGAGRISAAQAERVRCGIGDDCAVLSLPAGDEMLLSVDTLVESVHFPANYSPQLLARRALAVCVSDLAASGASPMAFTLALTLPAVDEDWLAAFSSSLADAAAEFGMILVGGDTTRGPLCLSLQVMGSAPAGQALLRSGAQVGDAIFVSGHLGDANAALAFLNTESSELLPSQRELLARYHAPVPRLALGQKLRNLATAAIDISDGLVADLGHILKASGVAGVIRLSDLPISAALAEHGGSIDSALSGGDDYELCFTAPASRRAEVVALAQTLNVALTEIGSIQAGSGLRCFDAQNNVYTPVGGYQHF
ncbi:Thiamine-monophosphate kinase [Zhongshania aliphaticivorans]|uniref:Thiamine-monophosphate kinase n=1 Tax=Zhongshania aliphaticivorans TaxID=1470434 RepID=A0A5S9MR18_9GAMM|nr:thiamine-phosphate kinase [Zhongshania aliphaticivorans]CAA0079561.1 Thiamine-monophosphate kinase [Zhongshania aliphaticivorans]CAA0086130.1 Thiamine-monophosphate kinase [Zhongshania aliphaticivorans]